MFPPRLRFGSACVGGPNWLLVFLLSLFLWVGGGGGGGGNVELASSLFCRPFRHALTASFRTSFSFLRPLPFTCLRNGCNVATLIENTLMLLLLLLLPLLPLLLVESGCAASVCAESSKCK